MANLYIPRSARPFGRASTTALAALAVATLATGCCPNPKRSEGPEGQTGAPGAKILPEEVHLANIRQLTFAGENAEAYWSFDGRELVFQASPPGVGCDRIYRLDLTEPNPTPVQVSSGEGATTCAYFTPDDKEIIYASTHLGGAECPPKPDHSQGYVWAIYDSYDIFKVGRDGGEPVRLTDTPGYDAEATVCAKDGSIVFTSVRDGDIDLYRMDADGGNVKRLTDTLGYDGGAFFNSDCSKIVWRASRPTGKALADYQQLLGQGLVRPTQLELYVANADGSNAQQITYLGVAAFGPYWHPNGKRILFSSNYPNPRGHEFDIWAIDSDGTDLERITYAPSFDGFPMFSPDGKYLAFASNRATKEDSRDTNVFVAEWVDSPPVRAAETAADRVWNDIAWLSDPARGGRGLGTPELSEAGAYVEKQMSQIGLAGAADGGSFRQSFDVPTSVAVGPGSRLTLDGKDVAPGDFSPLAYSAQGEASAAVVFAGYGLRVPEAGIDDYAGIDAKGKIVLVRRFLPEGKFADSEEQRRYSDLRYKAFVARERGAKALLVVDSPDPAEIEAAAKAAASGHGAGAPGGGSPHGGGAPGPASPHGAGAHGMGSPGGAPDEAPFPDMYVSGYSDAGLPLLIIKRALGEPIIAKLQKRGAVQASLKAALAFETTAVFNVVGKLAADAPVAERLAGVILVGAHYDHLGLGGPSSLAPDSHEPHLGADDNASGTAALLEVARQLSAQQGKRQRDVIFVGFTAEESGILGSNHFVRQLPGGLKAADVVAMLNLDMVGRMRNNELQVLGIASATEWPSLIEGPCQDQHVICRQGEESIGRADHTAFYLAGMPVLHFLTGPHEDYHKPSDTIERVNAAGAAQTAKVTAEVALAVMGHEKRLSYQRVVQASPMGDRRSFNASLGTVPDYAGPPKGVKGMLLAGVRPGGAAELAGMKRGDLLVKLSRYDIQDARDLMYALGALKPGQEVKAVIVRDGKTLELPITMQEGHRRPH